MITLYDTWAGMADAILILSICGLGLLFKNHDVRLPSLALLASFGLDRLALGTLDGTWLDASGAFIGLAGVAFMAATLQTGIGWAHAACFFLRGTAYLLIVIEAIGLETGLAAATVTMFFQLLLIGGEMTNGMGPRKRTLWNRLGGIAGSLFTLAVPRNPVATAMHVEPRRGADVDGAQAVD
jgi:hypothetical protein